jgi:hypothetical protein
MQALEIEPSKRFQNALEMSEALFNHPDAEVTTPPDVPDDDAETIRIDPLSQKHLQRWQASRPQATSSSQIPRRPLTQRPTSQPVEFEAIQTEWQQQPATSHEEPPKIAASAIDTNVGKETVSTQSSIGVVETQDTTTQNETTTTWFKQLQRLILGQQQHTMIAAAIIESPLSVQPNQVFTLRIHVMGRDQPTIPLDAKAGDQFPGLSRLMNGDTFYIEVHTVLNQNYIFVVQQATATIPAAGYITEITIPIKPFSSLPSGMRERFLISFLDKQRHTLYEKPFVVEVFVSHLVKRGHEGHHVLTIQ